MTNVFFWTQKLQGLLQWKNEDEASRTNRNAHTKDIAQLIWRQPIWISFLSEEPNFFQYRFGLLWENSSWPCSRSSLWVSLGLVSRLHKFPCLYASLPSSHEQPTLFVRKRYWKSQTQSYSHAANFTFQSTNLSAWLSSWPNHQIIRNAQGCYAFVSCTKTFALFRW